LEDKADHAVSDLRQLVVGHIRHVLAAEEIFALRRDIQGADDVHQG